MFLKYYKSLDGIRAIAALLVMLLHFFNMTTINSYALEIFASLSKIGQTGVTLFFVLSGFLITRILLNTKTHKNYLKNFYIKRVLRIFPLYYSFLLFYYCLKPLFFSTSFPIINPEYYYLFLQNIALTFTINSSGPGHFWSLAVEEHFYLIWPFVILLSSKKQLKRIIFFIVIFCLVLRFYMLINNYKVIWFTLTRIDSLAIGSFLAIYELKTNYILKKEKLILIGLVLIFLNITSYTIVHKFSFNLFQTIKYTLWSITFTYILYLLISNSKSLLSKLLFTKFFSFTGKISYGLYVYHLFAFEYVFYIFKKINWQYKFILGFLLSYFIATLSYYLLETPFLKLKKKFNS